MQNGFIVILIFKTNQGWELADKKFLKYIFWRAKDKTRNKSSILKRSKNEFSSSLFPYFTLSLSLILICESTFSALKNVQLSLNFISLMLTLISLVSRTSCVTSILWRSRSTSKRACNSASLTSASDLISKFCFSKCSFCALISNSEIRINISRLRILSKY